MSTDLVTIENEQSTPAVWTPAFTTPLQTAIAMRDQKRAFMKEIMEEGRHYGKVAAGMSPSLWKAGAESLLSNMGLAPTFEVLKEIREYGVIEDGAVTLEGEIYYRYRCIIYTKSNPRIYVADSEGSCTTREEKYRWRTAKLKCPNCEKTGTLLKSRNGGLFCGSKKGGCGQAFPEGDERIDSQPQGKVLNPNIAELDNTICKMAQKRALTSATLLATGCSDIFAQDGPDAEEYDDEPAPPQPAANARPAAAPTQTPREAPKPQPANREAAKPAPQPQAAATKLTLTPITVKARAALNTLIGPDSPLAKEDVEHLTREISAPFECDFAHPSDVKWLEIAQPLYNALKKAREQAAIEAEERKIEAASREAVPTQQTLEGEYTFGPETATRDR